MNGREPIITYDSGELIDEVLECIDEMGGEKEVAVWIRTAYGKKIITNFDLIEEDDPIDEAKECGPDEKIGYMTLGELLKHLKDQSGISAAFSV